MSASLDEILADLDVAQAQLADAAVDDTTAEQCGNLLAARSHVQTARQHIRRALALSSGGCGHIPRPGVCGGCRVTLQGLDGKAGAS